MRPGGALAVAIAVVVAGCRQVAGIGDRSTAPPPSACGGLAGAGAECDACLTSSCCDAMSDCSADPGCASAFACLAACQGSPDEVGSCRQRCRGSQAAGFDAALSPLLACQASACTAACGVSCGGYVYPDDACASCAHAHCCSAEADCGGDAECLAMSFCARACTGGPAPEACVGQCKLDHVTGADHADALSQCLVGSCAKECGDPQWSCLGHVVWTPPTGKPFGFGVTVFDAVTQAPLAGVGLKFCDATDYGCTRTYFQGATSANGTTGATLATQAAGYWELSVAGYPVTLVYWRPPLNDTLDHGALFLRMYSATTLANWFGTLDASRGVALVDVHGCAGGFARGVSVTASDPGATVFYEVGSLYTTSATQTDVSGLAAIVGLAPDTVTLGATVDEIGQSMDTFVGFVRPGGVTEVSLLPSPR